VFGNIKHNMNFKRFMLRGIGKVNVEIGLIAMAHNLKKYSLTL
ncbi:transposase, partial [Lutibacter sp.]